MVVLPVPSRSTQSGGNQNPNGEESKCVQPQAHWAYIFEFSIQI